jgi:hypothetical protein
MPYPYTDNNGRCYSAGEKARNNSTDDCSAWCTYDLKILLPEDGNCGNFCESNPCPNKDFPAFSLKTGLCYK